MVLNFRVLVMNFQSDFVETECSKWGWAPGSFSSLWIPSWLELLGDELAIRHSSILIWESRHGGYNQLTHGLTSAFPFCTVGQVHLWGCGAGAEGVMCCLHHDEPWLRWPHRAARQPEGGCSFVVDWVSGWVGDWVSGWVGQWVTWSVGGWVSGWVGQWVTG